MPGVIPDHHRGFIDSRPAADYCTHMPNSTSFPIYKPAIAPPPPSTKRLQPDVVDWRHGAVVRAPNWLGDTLMTLPAVYKLSTLMPNECRIAVVCPAPLAPLWNAAPWVNETISLHEKRLRGPAANTVRSFNAGVGVVLPNSFGSALDLFGKGIPVRAGRAGRGRRCLLTRCTPKWTPAERQAQYHQVSHYLDVVGLLGTVERSADYPSLTVADAQSTAAGKGVIQTGGEWLGIAPGAAYGPAKQWPLEAYTETARRWLANGGNVVILGTAKEAHLGAHIAYHAKGTLDLCGQTTLPELMAVLLCLHACVANDSGIMHLAAALGTPGAAVFGSTNPDATGPMGAPWVVLRRPPPCACCFQRECSLEGSQRYACLKAITPDDVMAALTRLSAVDG